MQWRTTAPILFAGFVALVPISVGAMAFLDYRCFFDTPATLLISMASIVFPIVVCDSIIELQPAVGIAGKKGQGSGLGEVRARFGILLIGFIVGWVFMLIAGARLWEYSAGATKEVITISAIASMYFIAFVSVGLTYKAIKQIVAL